MNYQKGQIDQFYHHYEYDADNRITNVYTSADNVIWERDAKYFYHLHGPLARMELGDQKVQAMDYAYTIQGWIKGVNSNILSANNDLGADGKANTRHQYIGTDAASYSLNYFRGDYHSIGTSNGTTDFLASIPSAHTGLNGSNSADNPNLYNGNISSMVTTIMNDLAQPQTQLTAYKYDQLNRIKQLKAYRDVNFTTAGLNTFAAAGSDGKYQENFTYDANGNILKLHRNGNLAGEQLEMDSLSYVYENKTNNYLRNTNRLRAVHDKLSLSGYYPDDIDNQDEDNYTYDEIGNLKSDVQEQIQEIKWNVYGKVQEVLRTPSSTKPNLEFVYDASGNRIAKIVKPAATKADAATWTVTYYMRDAQGNVLSTYEKKDLDFKLEEQYLYGSSRLGLKNRSLSLTGASSTATIQYYARSLSTKTFELSNHLGNVLSTVSDRKMGVSLATSPTLIDHYTAVVLSSTDYYAFGSPMPNRGYHGSGYRYGFQGQEKDEEWDDNIAFDFRFANPKLGRFLSLDPLIEDYPWNSPYAFSENRVNDGIELEGAEWKEIKNDQGKTTDFEWKGFEKNSDGKYVSPVGTVASGTTINGVSVNSNSETGTGTVYKAGNMINSTLATVNSENTSVDFFTIDRLAGSSKSNQVEGGYAFRTSSCAWCYNEGMLSSNIGAHMDAINNGKLFIPNPNFAPGTIEFDAGGQLTWTPSAIASTFGLLKTGLTLATKSTITGAAKYSVWRASRNFTSFMTPRELAAFSRTSSAGVRAMMKGKGVDAAFRYYASKNIILNSSQKLGLVQFGARTRGADMIGRGLIKGNWWDVTRRADWLKHTQKYGSGGTGLFY